MIIKKSLQERMNQVEQKDIKISTKKIIGAIQNHRISFDRDEIFFNKSCIPNIAQQAKIQVQTQIDPDCLGLKPKDWNSSVSIPKYPLLEESHERRMKKIKLGLLDEHHVEYVPRKEFEGVEYRDDSSGWNLSTKFNRQDLTKSLVNLTKITKEKTKLKEPTLIQSYLDPLSWQNNETDKMRELKQMDCTLRSQIRDQFIFENPNSSEEKITTAVFRLMYEQRLKKKQNKVEIHYTHLPRINPPKRKWGPQPGLNLEDEESYAWSCCMNENENSEGCTKIMNNKDRWNMVSYNS